MNKELEELRRQNEELRSMIQLQRSVIFRFIKAGDDFVYEFIDGALLTSWGYRPEELIGKRPQEVVSPRNLPDTLLQYERAWNGELVEYELPAMHGPVYLIVLQPVFEAGEVKHVIGFTADISKQKEAEAALAESKARLEESQRITKIGGWNWQMDSQELVLSDEIYRILQIPNGEIVTKELLADFVHPEDRGTLFLYLNLLVKGKPLNHEFRIVQSRNVLRWLHVRAELMKNEAGKPTKIIGTLQDISERKFVELEMLRVKHFLESFIRQHVDPILLISKNGLILSVNPAFEEEFGWMENDCAGGYLYEQPFVPNELQDEVIDNLTQVVLKGNPIIGYETVWRKRSGQRVDVSISAFPIRNGLGLIENIAVVVRDITQKKETEELLHRSDKLNIVGQLAAGVAHEIRNPLTAIKGFLQIMMSGEGNVKPGYLSVMSEELKRMEFIINEMLLLAKPQPVQFRQKAIDGLLREVMSLLEPQANLHGVTIIHDVPTVLPPIRCIENQLKQVMINVIKNAIESMPKGGVIKVSAAQNNRGDLLLIRVADQGEGISEENLKRIGEPFYTTKDNGAGLGLMVTSKIVADHGGKMSFQSKVGVGTTVLIDLPTT